MAGHHCVTVRRMSATRYGTFEELVSSAEPAVRAIAVRLRDVVLGVHPEAFEVVRLGDRAATYGLGPRKMIEGYCYVMPQSSWVNLGFYQGAALPDPADLLDGNGARLRHVKVRSLEAAADERLVGLIEAALHERRQALTG